MSTYAKITRDRPLDDCIFGTMLAGGSVFYTLERPWLDNTEDISCIPTGFYTLRYKSKSNNGKLNNVYEFLSVPNRAGVLIHTGNWVHESKGCILIGLGRDIEQKKLVSSQLAMAQLIELMGKSFDLLIEERGSV